MRTQAFVAIAAAALLLSARAEANGRFPESNAIVLADSDPELVLLRTTFGLLVSHDRGKTWDWVCDRSIGTAGVEDPMYAVTENGTYVGATFQGLAISRDKACSFAYAGGALEGQVFIDVASRRPDPRAVVAFASAYDFQDDAGNIQFASRLYETKDDAVTFATLGAKLDSSLLGETVDVTASDPDRIYVSAVRDPGATSPHAVLLTSRDHGKAFEESPIALEGSERAAYIAGVDPKNADRLYVRTSNAPDLPGRLLASDDAGKTWRTIYTGAAALLGFALSADGGKVYVGGPRDGIRVASTTDFAFKQTSTIEAQCLAASKDGLWACSNEKSGFVAALSPDDGATFATKLHFCDIRGPLACGAGTTTSTECNGAWPAQRGLLGCGTTPADGGGGSDAGLAAPGDPNDLRAGGGCSLRGAPTSPLAALVAATGAAIALVRRTRRARR